MKFYLSCKKLFDEAAINSKLELCKDINKDYKFKQLNIKINHSYRTVDIIEQIFNNFNCLDEYKDVAKGIMILHDYGRLDQMVTCGTYVDSKAFENIKGIEDHAEYGAILLFKVGDIKKTNLDPSYYKLMYDAIYYHSKKKLPLKLQHQINGKLLRSFSEFLIDENNHSLYAQAVRDADKLDIYNQVVTGEIPLYYKNINYPVMGETLNEISNYWGLDSELLSNYNNLEDKNLKNVKKLSIPVEQLDIDRLQIPKHFIESFKEGTIPSLKELLNEGWYHFLCAQVFRLNFLRDVNFISSLKYLNDHDLLWKMYEQYPDKYKPLMIDVFKYADKYLIKDKLKTKGLYVKG